MTKTEYRQELKRLHPDMNGGNPAGVPALIRLMKHVRPHICDGGSPNCMRVKRVTSKNCFPCATWLRYYANKLAP